jgi:hypothetical protein
MCHPTSKTDRALVNYLSSDAVSTNVRKTAGGHTQDKLRHGHGQRNCLMRLPHHQDAVSKLKKLRSTTTRREESLVRIICRNESGNQKS